MQSLPSLSTCILCGTCTCIPQDDILIQHQGLSEQRDFVREDSVTWLSRYRLIVACALEDQMYPSAITQEAHVTGLVRHRGRRTSQDRHLEFARGNAVDINLGAGTKSIKGEGEYEVISVPQRNLTNLLHNQRRIFLFIHEGCLVILNQAQIIQGQIGNNISINELMVDFLPETVDQLLLVYKNLQKPCCSSESAWLGGTGCEIEREAFTMPKVYFLDPLSEDHISRYARYSRFFSRGMASIYLGEWYASNIDAAPNVCFR